jgi:hypothetical protein
MLGDLPGGFLLYCADNCAGPNRLSPKYLLADIHPPDPSAPLMRADGPCAGLPAEAVDLADAAVTGGDETGVFSLPM